MILHYNNYEIDDDLSRVDFEVVHSWLTSTYWSPDISRVFVERAASYSAIVVGVYTADRQVGYARVVTDTVRFAYVADVYVSAEYRGAGVGQAIIRFILDHPLLEDLPHITLKTLDAHSLYAKAGFEPIRDPENWLRWNRGPRTC